MADLIKMFETREHPIFGKLKYRNGRLACAWITVPAFDAWLGTVQREVRYNVTFSAGEIEQVPTTLIAIFERALQQPEQTVQLLTEFVWGVLNGRRPDVSGLTWMHNGLAELRSCLDEGTVLERWEDLLPLMGLAVIYVDADSEPMHLRFSFRTDLDPEHGLDLATDGKRVLGLGDNSGSMDFFEHA